MPQLKRTPLYDEHVRLGARLVPFAGFEMPVQYSGIAAEHGAVRERAGLFDVSHMGEFAVRGPGAVEFTNSLVTNDVSLLDVGQALYTPMCTVEGGIVDDLLIYRFPDWIRLVVNASNIEKDFAHIQGRLRDFDGGAVDLEDESEDIGLLALQGPLSEKILEPLADVDLSEIQYYRFAEVKLAGETCVVSRTGYTGEDGFEIYCDATSTPGIWNAVMEAGAPHAAEPVGLGARDSLRLEMGYALYGNDIDESTTPLEARLGWTVKLNKDEFVGRAALSAQKERGVERKLSGFILEERGFPRPGYAVQVDGKTVGEIRSGTVGPSVGQGIGTVYLPSESSDPGTTISVVIRGKELAANVVRMPFYAGGSLKR